MLHNLLTMLFYGAPSVLITLILCFCFKKKRYIGKHNFTSPLNKHCIILPSFVRNLLFQILYDVISVVILVFLLFTIYTATLFGTSFLW